MTVGAAIRYPPPHLESFRYPPDVPSVGGLVLERAVILLTDSRITRFPHGHDTGVKLWHLGDRLAGILSTDDDVRKVERAFDELKSQILSAISLDDAFLQHAARDCLKRNASSSKEVTCLIAWVRPDNEIRIARLSSLKGFEPELTSQNQVIGDPTAASVFNKYMATDLGDPSRYRPELSGYLPLVLGCMSQTIQEQPASTVGGRVQAALVNVRGFHGLVGWEIADAENIEQVTAKPTELKTALKSTRLRHPPTPGAPFIRRDAGPQSPSNLS